MPDQDERAAIRDRLAKATSRDEVEGILGRRRMWGYAFGFLAATFASAGYAIYLLLDATIGQTSAWTLGLLPAPLLLGLFTGTCTYAMFYYLRTGNRFPTADRIDAILGWITTVNIWPPLRHRRRR
jgi:hypothetical protein